MDQESVDKFCYLNAVVLTSEKASLDRQVRPSLRRRLEGDKLVSSLLKEE